MEEDTWLCLHMLALACVVFIVIPRIFEWYYHWQGYELVECVTNMKTGITKRVSCLESEIGTGQKEEDLSHAIYSYLPIKKNTSVAFFLSNRDSIETNL
jgi:hypothetical protein